MATADGTVMYYIQPPSTYDQTAFDLTGDYDLFGHPGDQWRYYLVSGISANMTSEPTVAGRRAVLLVLRRGVLHGVQHRHRRSTTSGANQVQGYVLVQGILQWPNLNTNAETFADVQVYKAMSLLDTFPIGDPEVLVAFLKAQYPGAAFVANNALMPPRPGNDEISLVFAKNIISYFGAQQQTLIPQSGSGSVDVRQPVAGMTRR